MTTIAPVRPSYRLLRGVLIADASVGLVTAVGILMATSTYAGPTGLPESLLRWSAVVLLCYVVALAVAVVLRPVRRALVIGIIVANGAWVAASLVVIALVPTTPFGVVYVIGQALVVAGFGVAEAVALRRLQD